MSSLKDFTREVSRIKAALSHATALAKDAGYRQVDFRSLQERLHRLDIAIVRQVPDEVSSAMDAINGIRQVQSAAYTWTAPPSPRVQKRSAVVEHATEQVTLEELRAKAGKIGGKKSTPAKQRAARANGLSGGRPRKTDQ